MNQMRRSWKRLIFLFRDHLYEIPCILAQHCPKDNTNLTFISIIVPIPTIDSDCARVSETACKAY